MENPVEKGKQIKSDGRLNYSDLVIRVCGLVLSLTAAITLMVNKQTVIVHVPVLPTFPPLDVSLTAKYHYISGLLYFVVANIMACSYAALSSLILITKTCRNKRLSLTMITVDLLMVALLFSSIGAAGEVGVLGLKGNSHVHWKKVCNTFDKFCRQFVVAAGFSLFAAILFLLLVLLAVFNLHKKSK